MNTIECIKSRASVRSYKPDGIPDNVLDEVLDAAIHAPSAGNVQDWEFVVVRNQDTKGRLEPLKRHQHSTRVLKAPLCQTATLLIGGSAPGLLEVAVRVADKGDTIVFHLGDEVVRFGGFAGFTA